MKKLTYKPLSSFADLLNGYAFKSKNYVDKGIRVIRIANVQDGYISDESPCFYPEETKKDISKYLLNENDFLVSLTGNVGRVAILTADFLPAALNQRVSCIRIKDKNLLPKFLFYYLLRRQFQQDCINASKGVAQLNLSTKWLEQYPIPVIELEDQKRIVSKIEELFSELDNNIETLKNTKQQLAVYRQAVLKEAFKECDKKVAVESVCQHVTDGDHMPPPKTKQGVPFIMISNIENHIINWNNTAYVGDEYYNNIDVKRRPCRGDVLYTVTGSYGIPVLINYEKKFCFQRHIALLRPNESINQKFLYYAMQSPDVYAQATKGATGTAQKTVGLAVLRKIQIPYCANISKQEKIVTDIETKISLCNSVDDTIDTTLKQAEAMRQSILKKAFEGEL